MNNEPNEPNEPDEIIAYYYNEYAVLSNDTQRKQQWFKWKKDDNEWEEIETYKVPDKVFKKFITDRLLGTNTNTQHTPNTPEERKAAKERKAAEAIAREVKIRVAASRAAIGKGSSHADKVLNEYTKTNAKRQGKTTTQPQPF